MLVMFAAAFSLTLLTVLKILSSFYGYRDPALVPERVFSLMTLLLLLSSLLWPAILLLSSGGADWRRPANCGG